MNKNDIRRCPFCGGLGKLSAGYSERDNEAFYYVRCMKCGARGQSYTNSQTKLITGAGAAVKAWNRRTESRFFPAQTPEMNILQPYCPENAGISFPAYDPDKDAATPADIEKKIKQDPSTESPETSGEPAEDPAEDPAGLIQADSLQPEDFA